MELSVNQVKAKIDEYYQDFVYGKCVSTLKGTCPVDTGALQGSIHAEQMSENTYFVGTDFWYAKFTEYGHKEVFPVVKRALWWPDIKGGRPVPHTKGVEPMMWVEDAVAKLK